MTALALVALAGCVALLADTACRPLQADVLLRDLVLRDAAAQGVAHAERLGLVNPPVPRRWSHDRKPSAEPAPRVLDLMPRS